MKDIDAVKKLFISYLDKKKLRKTPERFAILEEIYSRSDHFDIESLYKSMHAKKFIVSRATLYNTIELLLDCNLVIKHQFNNSMAIYEKAWQRIQHDHIINIESGNVFEFCDPRIQDIISTACKQYNMTPVSHSLIIYGQKNRDT